MPEAPAGLVVAVAVATVLPPHPRAPNVQNLDSSPTPTPKVHNILFLYFTIHRHLLPLTTHTTPHHTAAEVYPVRSSIQQDPTKRGGRWQSDFIWNSNWKEALDMAEDVRRQVEEGRREKANQTQDGKGFLSLRSKVDLNSMDVDLSSQLKPRRQAGGDGAGGAEGNRPAGGPRPKAGSVSQAGYAANPGTRGELRAWDRSGRYSRKPVAVTSSTAAASEAEAKAAAENARYDELKQELQFWAATLTAVCLGATYLVYGRNVAASYGVGAAGGLFYLRLLNQSVDGIGYGGMGAAMGQNRLLIPIILALGFNRYNNLAAEETGVTLQLLPMLVGFFTYKGAVIARQSVVLFEEWKSGIINAGNGGGVGMTPEEQQQTEGSLDSNNSNNNTSGGEQQFDVTNVDRAFNKKMLNDM